MFVLLFSSVAFNSFISCPLHFMPFCLFELTLCFFFHVSFRTLVFSCPFSCQYQCVLIFSLCRMTPSLFVRPKIAVQRGCLGMMISRSFSDWFSIGTWAIPHGVSHSFPGRRVIQGDFVLVFLLDKSHHPQHLHGTPSECLVRAYQGKSLQERVVHCCCGLCWFIAADAPRWCSSVAADKICPGGVDVPGAIL